MITMSTTQIPPALVLSELKMKDKWQGLGASSVALILEHAPVELLRALHVQHLATAARSIGRRGAKQKRGKKEKGGGGGRKNVNAEQEAAAAAAALVPATTLDVIELSRAALTPMLMRLNAQTVSVGARL